MKLTVTYDHSDFINNPCIVAFCGEIGVGKSTLAHDLADSTGGAVLSFADPLRDMIAQIVDKDYLTSEMVGDVRAKDVPIPWLGYPEKTTGRKLLQYLGTEFGRDLIDPEIWVKVAKQRVQEYDPDKHIFFDDLRFNNEAQMIRSLGGLVVEVTRSGYRYDGDSHKSEQGISPRYINGGFKL
jgi:hypothetical protein